METPGTYLTAPQALAPDHVAAYLTWLTSFERSWRERFQPDPLDLLGMALALEALAGTLRQEASRSPHAPTPLQPD